MCGLLYVLAFAAAIRLYAVFALILIVISSVVFAELGHDVDLHSGEI